MAKTTQAYMALLLHFVTIWALISVGVSHAHARGQISFDEPPVQVSGHPDGRSMRQVPLPDPPEPSGHGAGAALNYRALATNNYRNFYRNRNYFVRDEKPEHNTVIPLNEEPYHSFAPPAPPSRSPTPAAPKIDDLNPIPTNDPILFEDDMEPATPYSANHGHGHNAYVRPLPPLDVAVFTPAPAPTPSAEPEPPSTSNTNTPGIPTVAAVDQTTTTPRRPTIGRPLTQKFEPAPDGKPPACAEDAVYCEVSNNYPKALLNQVLERSITPEEFQQVYGDTTDNSTKITDIKSILQRTGLNTGQGVEETPLCSAVEHTIYPQIARNKDNKWLYVVNHDEYIQGVRIEKCLDEGQSCFYGDTGPAGYHTACRQKYIYKKLLALTPEGRTSSESFKLPSCCSCFVKTASIADRLLGVHSQPQSVQSQSPAVRVRPAPALGTVASSTPNSLSASQIQTQSRPRPLSSLSPFGSLSSVTKLPPPPSYSYAYEHENQDDIDNSTEIFITTQSMEGVISN